MRCIIGVVVLTLFAAVPGATQPNCKKGKPCGGTCIAQNRTCHIESRPASEPRTSERQPTANAAPVQSLYAPAPASAAAPVDSLLPWVISVTGGTYFASACSGAESIVPANRMFFRNEENLKRAGMSRATAKEERCTLQQMQEHERRLTPRQP